MISELYDALRGAGVSEEAAKAAAKAVLPAEPAATKADLADLRAEIYRVAAAQTIVLVGVMVALRLFG